eukprot:908334-Rhodomonas_salina.1
MERHSLRLHEASSTLSLRRREATQSLRARYREPLVFSLVITIFVNVVPEKTVRAGHFPPIFFLAITLSPRESMRRARYRVQNASPRGGDPAPGSGIAYVSTGLLVAA